MTVRTAPVTAQAPGLEETKRDSGELGDLYTQIAIWGLPVLALIIILWAAFRHMNRTRGIRAGGIGPLRDPAGRPAAAKTATQLRAAEIHQHDYQSPVDECFDAGDDEESAWIVGHDGQTLDFDWNEDLGFHDRRLERREKHPNDPRPDKPPTPTPSEGLRTEDAMLIPSPLSPTRPYVVEVLDGDEDEDTDTA